MPYVPVNIVLTKKMRAGDDFSLPYPAGKNKGSFFGVFNHTMACEDRFYRAPNDFLVIPEDDRLLMYWRSPRLLPKDAIMHLQLEEMGSAFYFDPQTGVTVQNTLHANIFMINLQSPLPASTSHFMPSAPVTAAGALTLANPKSDVPRNVTIHSSGDDSARTFRVEGDDVYLRPMIEDISGGNAGISEGKKAFARIARITVDGPCAGDIQIGFGMRLGIPVFLPASGYVIRELINGEIAPAGIIEPGEFGVPAAKTGDRRGVYIPSPTVTLDGHTPVHLLISLPNPGNIGTPDYAGELGSAL